MSAFPAQLEPPYRTPKVLIVGLLDRQQAIARREYQTLDIRFTDKESITEGPLYKWADRTLVMHKWISHSLFHNLDRSTVEYFTGFKRLRQLLDKIVTEAKNAPRLAATATRAFVPTFVPDDDTMPTALIDYSALRTAKAGDVIIFTRPDNVEAHAFAQNLETALVFYNKKCGVVASKEIRGGRAEVLIERGVERPLLEAAELAFLPRERINDLTFRLPDVDEQARSFWCDTYKASFKLKPYASSDVHAEAASFAAKGWFELCGSIDGSK
jgi:hypothetical protein